MSIISLSEDPDTIIDPLAADNPGELPPYPTIQKL